MTRIHTVQEVADLLRIEVSAVERVLADGGLRGLQINGQWRVRQEDLSSFLAAKVRSQHLAAMRHALQDPKRWAAILPDCPVFLRQMYTPDYPDGTFGHFLKRGWESLG